MFHYITNKRIRFGFGKIFNISNIPNLIKIQKKSYRDFLQSNFFFRKNVGLKDILNIFCNIKYPHRTILKNIDHYISSSLYTPLECISKGVTYSCLVRAKFKVIFLDNGKVYKEQEIIIGELPLMTSQGTFIINGAQRVIVSQLHRSPGIYYFNNKSPSTSHIAKIIPYYGSWIDLEINNEIFFKLDKKKRIPITILFKALGFKKNDIFHLFCHETIISLKHSLQINKIDLVTTKAKKSFYIIDILDGSIVHTKKINYITMNLIMLYPSRYYCLKEILLVSHCLFKRNNNTLSCSIHFNNNYTFFLKKMNIDKIILIYDKAKYIYNTLAIDNTSSRRDALFAIHKTIKFNEPFILKNIERILNDLFSKNARYYLSNSGRLKINCKNHLCFKIKKHFLDILDIVFTIKKLIRIKDNNMITDDINSLSNRRVKTIGELVGNQFQLGFSRIYRSMVEKTDSINNIAALCDSINTKSITNIIREFFCISQLSQFMDQTNSLSEITHKRRLSSLGPGGLIKDRAGFDVRDVHQTYYGKICPIETPEGNNIGLISSLSLYAGIDNHGFINTPYRKVRLGFVSNKILKITSLEEEMQNIILSTNNVNVSRNNIILNDVITCSSNGEIIKIQKNKINLIHIFPGQIVSVAASLIPFLENNDANRALMGSNMQRQAVPLMINEAPLIGTGLESVISRDSKNVIIARRSGVIIFLDSKKIIINVKDNFLSGIDIYELTKFNKSNQGTCINQKPVVNLHDNIKTGQLIADSSSTDMGELSLGKNVLTAFMTWQGFNFEDAIIFSNRLVMNDIFTSVHIEEQELLINDTRSVSEEITRDVPGVNEYHLRHLDDNGISCIGARVIQNDILVGKIVPKNYSPLTPEEKLLRSVFGEKASEVKNLSLRADTRGVVIGVRVFSRKMFLDKQPFQRSSYNKYIYNNNSYRKKIIKEYIILSARCNMYINVVNIFIDKLLRILRIFYINYLSQIDLLYNTHIINNSINLPQGVTKSIKIYIACKAKVGIGDKISGRHGNKGVVSKIVPLEDMPFSNNGDIIDVMLNPLGVPSRMNIGQIFEMHLGWMAKLIAKQTSAYIQQYTTCISKIKNGIIEILSMQNNKLKHIVSFVDNLNDSDILNLALDISKGLKIAIPVFSGLDHRFLTRSLTRTGLDKSGQIFLRDGKTGCYFKKKVSVGYMYLMKLDHLVDCKIHARSVGPYSLITQQPLGGKSHFGGQRIGEMECWALQAYGAAYTLKEMLTIKSDDVMGRINAYDSIIRGNDIFESSLPESFKVMIKEMRSLCLDIRIKEIN